jgi:hypothetical protein
MHRSINVDAYNLAMLFRLKLVGRASPQSLYMNDYCTHTKVMVNILINSKICLVGIQGMYLVVVGCPKAVRSMIWVDIFL